MTAMSMDTGGLGKDGGRRTGRQTGGQAGKQAGGGTAVRSAGADLSRYPSAVQAPLSCSNVGCGRGRRRWGSARACGLCKGAHGAGRKNHAWGRREPVRRMLGRRGAGACLPPAAAAHALRRAAGRPPAARIAGATPRGQRRVSHPESHDCAQPLRRRERPRRWGDVVVGRARQETAVLGVRAQPPDEPCQLSRLRGLGAHRPAGPREAVGLGARPGGGQDGGGRGLMRGRRALGAQGQPRM